MTVTELENQEESLKSELKKESEESLSRIKQLETQKEEEMEKHARV